MTLAAQDIVITTYNVLRAELKTTNVPHSNSDSGRRLRKPKKFLALPSPLTAVQWWRVSMSTVRGTIQWWRMSMSTVRGYSTVVESEYVYSKRGTIQWWRVNMSTARGVQYSGGE